MLAGSLGTVMVLLALDLSKEHFFFILWLRRLRLERMQAVLC